MQLPVVANKVIIFDGEIFYALFILASMSSSRPDYNSCLLFEVNWNPSYDEQAQDRAYRIGQENNVEVIRLVARGTIEEQMYARQVYKVQLKKQTLGGNADGTNQPQIFRGVDKDDKRKGELFGIENLLMFRDGSFMQLLVSSLDSL